MIIILLWKSPLIGLNTYESGSGDPLYYGRTRAMNRMTTRLLHTKKEAAPGIVGRINESYDQSFRDRKPS